MMTAVAMGDKPSKLALVVAGALNTVTAEQDPIPALSLALALACREGGVTQSTMPLGIDGVADLFVCPDCGDFHFNEDATCLERNSRDRGCTSDLVSLRAEDGETL